MSVLLVKPKVLNAAKKKELKDAGYVVIEVKDPNDVTILDEFQTASKDMILTSALESLNWGNDATCRNAFGKLFREKLLKKMGIKID